MFLLLQLHGKKQHVVQRDDTWFIGDSTSIRVHKKKKRHTHTQRAFKYRVTVASGYPRQEASLASFSEAFSAGEDGFSFICKDSTFPHCSSVAKRILVTLEPQNDLWVNF